MAGAYLVGVLRPPVKYASVIGSFWLGWQGRRAVNRGDLGPEGRDAAPVMSKGLPKEADYAALDALAATIAQKHGECNLM